MLLAVAAPTPDVQRAWSLKKVCSERPSWAISLCHHVGLRGLERGAGVRHAGKRDRGLCVQWD